MIVIHGMAILPRDLLVAGRLTALDESLFFGSARVAAAASFPIVDNELADMEAADA